MKVLFHTLKHLSAFLSIVLIPLTIAFIYLTYERSQMPYNEVGRYFDVTNNVAYEHDAYVGFLVMTVILFFSSLLSVFIFTLLKKKGY